MDWGQVITVMVPVIILIVEYYLGKTKSVESNSALEILEKFLFALGKLFKK